MAILIVKGAMMENDERNEIIKTAEQGDAIGQYNLGAMYNYGEGVEQY